MNAQRTPSLASLANELRHWEQQADYHYFPPGADWPELDRRDHARCEANAAECRGEIARLYQSSTRKAAA